MKRIREWSICRKVFTFERGWENWCNRVGRPYVSGVWETGSGYSRTDG